MEKEKEILGPLQTVEGADQQTGENKHVKF